MRVQNNPYYRIMMRLIPADATVLDLGCGRGDPFIDTNFKKLIGIDLFSKKFDMPEYTKIMYRDIKKIDKMFLPKSFDVITAIDVIEHLTKREGGTLLKNAEIIAKDMILIFTPLVWSDNKEHVEDESLWCYGNKYNYHKSLWTIKDFIKRGYNVVPCQEGYVLAVKVLK